MLKWIQLDLARQMESMECLESFVETMADAGYNGILLYLEDRIRTASYPYSKDNECYTEEQIRHLVEFAAARGIEMVPCVATLGHAERFLRHKELDHLSELQGDMVGRFGSTSKDVFCPTNPDFYPFMEKYLQEVAAIFPSQYFHAGLDEFFSFCRCPRCKAVAPDYIGEKNLFVEHIIRIHDILKRLGKRMMMWSDMFEIYREAIAEIPNDVVMVDWQYQRDVRFYLDHLLDCRVDDRFALNEKLGIECLIAPADFTLGNMLSCAKYAEVQKSCIGFLQTNWEKASEYLPRYIPMYVCIGLHLNGMKADDAFAETCRRLFGTDDASLRAALKLAYTNGIYHFSWLVSENSLFIRDFMGMPYDAQEADSAAYDVIKARQGAVTTEVGRRIIEDLLDALHARTIANKLKTLYHDVLDGIAKPFDEIAALHEEYVALMESIAAKWDAHRKGITPNVLAASCPKVRERLAKNLDALRNSPFLKLRICVPDGYGVQHTRLSLRKGGEWHQVVDKVFKPNYVGTALAECFVPFPKELLGADALRIESFGLGGEGVCWVELAGAKAKAILSVHGIVEHPENLLDNDVKFAWFGSQNSYDDYMDSNRTSAVHSVELSF